MNEKVTVIIATYNRSKLLKKAIQSVIAQTYTNWELIIVDDGSTDNTFVVVNKFFQKIDNLIYLKQKNSKLWAARNIGIKLAQGDFITFLDSDDEYKRDHLKLRIDFMNKNINVDLIHGGIEIIGNPFVPDKLNRKRKIHINDCVVGGTFFGRRKVFVELEGFKNIDYSEDSEFFDRAKKKFVIEKVDFPTYIYNRTNTDSITKNFN